MVFKNIQQSDLPHEQIVFGYDQATGLKAIVAIHNTNLGFTLGGCRMHPYQNEQEALQDVLLLSEAMSYKAAFAGLELGGAKSVIIADPKTDKTPELLKAYGKFIHSLGGQYIAAKDVGIDGQDLLHVREATPYVVGLPHPDGTGGPSSATAQGVFQALKWGVQKKLNKPTLKGVRVVIEGVGAVGQELMKSLLLESAEVFIYDIRADILESLKKEYPSLHVLKQSEVFQTPCDVFAPCALGGSLNEKTIDLLDCSLIAGAANNQLASKDISQKIFQKDILYLPDFVINSGGLVFVYSLLDPKKPQSWVEEKLQNLPKTLDYIANISKKENVDMGDAALKFAFEKINKAKTTDGKVKRVNIE